MSSRNKEIVRRFYEEIFNKGNLDVVDEVVSEGYTNHNAPPGLKPGRESLRQFATTFCEALPDIVFTIEDQVAEGDKVVSRYTARATHKGELFGVPATGKQTAFTGMVLMRVADDQVQEAWLNWDVLGLMKQIGAIP